MVLPGNTSALVEILKSSVLSIEYRSKTMPQLYAGGGVSLTCAPDGILTLLLDKGENRFNPSFITDISDAISAVDAAPHPKALVVTGRGKFFSNGLDVEWMGENAEGTAPMIESVLRLLARFLAMDCRTVAAINGHAFGAGLFLALACDFRVMRTQKGFLNFPEVNIGMPLTKGFAELSKAKVSAMTLREGVLTCKRYSSVDAIKAGLIDNECSIEDLSATAEKVALAGLPENLGLINFDPQSFSAIKIELYTDAYRALTLGKVPSPSQSRI